MNDFILQIIFHYNKLADKYWYLKLLIATQKDERKKDFKNPKYSNTKPHCKLYYVEDLLYLDY
jgi:hypothetical protein